MRKQSGGRGMGVEARRATGEAKPSGRILGRGQRGGGGGMTSGEIPESRFGRFVFRLLNDAGAIGTFASGISSPPPPQPTEAPPKHADKEMKPRK